MNPTKKSIKITDTIIICLFIIFITLPAVFMNTRPDQVSEIDNTRLIDFNEIGSKDSFTRDAETYISQRIGFRTQMINAYIYGNDRLFDVLLHPNYTYGKDGYVFFHMPKENPDPRYLESFVNYISYMQNYCEENGIDFLYCINPDKTEVYSQYLPKGANLTFYRQNYLRSLLNKNNINYMDNTEILKEASKTTQVFNKKYDAGHWNETGAYIGISNILKHLHQINKNIPLNKESDYTAKDVIYQYLPLSYFEINEPSVIYERNNPQVTDITAEDTDIILDTTYRDYSHYINNAHPEYPKILVFRGSYFLEKEKFMNESFSESIFVHSYYNIFNIDYYVKKFKPDIVLFESVEYATINRYFPRNMLKSRKSQNIPNAYLYEGIE